MTLSGSSNDTTGEERGPGRLVLVTGGSLGIGREIARAFAAIGDRVLLVARNAGDLAEARETLSAEGGRIDAIPCDVSDGASVASLMTEIRARHPRVDVLVNNAGIYGPVGPFAENDIDHWIETVEINLFGLVRMTRAVLPEMLAAGAGNIINLSGGGATGPKPGYSAYAASKTAVVRFTEGLAHELSGTGIRVNAIAPGFIATRLHEETLSAGEGAPDRAKVLEKLESGGDDPRRAADLAVFLASPRASGVDGRLISAIWDEWEGLADSTVLESSDLFTLRRIDDMFYAEVPRT